MSELIYQKAWRATRMEEELLKKREKATMIEVQTRARDSGRIDLDFPQ
jgi:hypothetical protein